MDKPESTPILEARNLKKFYGKGENAVAALKDVSFAIKPGEFVAILGPSGSGKSTLLNMLGLMDRPDAGEVLIGGKKALSLSEEARSSLRNEKLGFIFQFDALLSDFTIIENILFPALISSRSRNESYLEVRKRALGLLEHLKLPQIAERYPSQVSGGERQRAALCRALINNPEILLADEPTGNLDKVNGEMVFNDLEGLALEKNAAVVLVTHNEEAAARAARVFHMRDGALVEADSLVKGVMR